MVSPFMKIEIGNALYERVKVFCKVLFHENQALDSNILRRKFIQDINIYIAPWHYNEDANLKIGSKIYKAELLIYLKNLSYVKYISGFSLLHYFNESDLEGEDLYAHVNDSATSRIDVLEGSTPASVFIPSPFHIVEILQDFDYSKPEKSGIGNFVIGEEFLVAKEVVEKEKEVVNEEAEEQFGLIISHNID